ncbi:MAG: choice-of-anchor D domain-containing protein [Solirubrobacteraceae bacterium]|nr:choice-of-anchor D domain-containing protein [Solirubrobacteraceae bacterium]
MIFAARHVLRLMLAVVAGLLLLGAGLVPTATAETLPVTFSSPDPLYDALDANSTLRRTVIVTNTSDKPLLISSVYARPSGGARLGVTFGTVAPYAECLGRNLAPGAQCAVTATTIVVSLDWAIEVGVYVPPAGSNTRVGRGMKFSGTIGKNYLSPPSLDLGEIPLGVARDVTVDVGNKLSTPLTFADPALSISGPIEDRTGDFSPLAGSRPFTFRVQPDALGANSATVTFNFGAGTSPTSRTYTVQWTAVGATAELSATDLDFGDVSSREPVEREVVVRNTGNRPLTFDSSTAVTGAGFSLVSPDLTALPAGESRTLRVRFAPTRPGAVDGALTLKTNASGGDRTVGLSGVGHAPVLDLDAAPAASDSIVFSDTAIGRARERRLTLTNTGDEDLSISLVAMFPGLSSASFSIPDAITDPVVLAPGASRQVTLRFAPTRAGKAAGLVVLVANDPSFPSGQRTVSVSGSGYVPGVPVVDPTALAFGGLEVGQDRPLALTVSNTGPRAFTVTGVTAPSADVTVEGLTTPSEVGPGAGEGFNVRWTPEQAGELSGDLVIETTEGDLRVPLSGTATSSRLFSKGRPADTGGDRPTQVALADLDGDGDQDLVTGYAADGRVAVSLGAGNGTFGAPATLDAASGPGSFGLAVADFDADGALDVTTGRAVYLGAGDGTFAAGVATSLVGEDVVTGDFDGDGSVDLAVSSLDAGQVLVALGDGDGSFGAPTAYDTVGRPGSPVAADVDRDGDLDVIVGGRAAEQDVEVLRGDGRGGFSQERYATPSATPYALAIGDLNGDLRPDLSAAHSWLAGQADGRFSAAADGSSSSDDLAIADFDGDGYDDQVVTGHEGPQIFVSHGLGDGTFAAPDEYDVGTSGGDEFADLAVGDLNGDGRVDVVAAKGGTQVDVLLNRQGVVADGAGQAVISELRFGSGGYVQVQNTDRQRPLRLDGWQLRFSTGARITLPPSSVVQAGGTLLVSEPANAGWPFAELARSVLALPGGAVDGVRLVDAAGNPVDAAGFDAAAPAYHEGTAITSVAGSALRTYVRRFANGARVDTGDNAADFVAIDPEATPESGLLLGSPRPDGLTAPTNRNDILSSSLLDPSVAASSAPNRVVGGGKLTINRTITNCIGQPKSGVCVNADTSAPGDTVTKLRLRLTELTTIGSPGTGAILKVVASEGATYGDREVSGLTLDAPTPVSGGGLNSTLTATLPGAGLGPGESINVAITFTIVRGGTFRIGYDAEDDLVRRPKPSDEPPTPTAPNPTGEPAAIDPAPAPAAPAVSETTAGAIAPSAAALTEATPSAPAQGAPRPAAGAATSTKKPAAKKRCVTRAKYRKLTTKQRRAVRICAAAKTPKAPKTPSAGAATRR